jgi:hypothetical protein
MRRFLTSTGAGLVLATSAWVGSAQERQPSPAAATQVDPGAIVAEVRRIIAERYVLPERRPALDAVLARGLASGRYDVRQPAALAERINADLETEGKDRHLNFALDPQQAEILSAARNESRPDTGAYERQVRAANHGVTELKLLPGNIRYLAYDGFHWIGPESAAALDTAMRFLAGGDAVIIDIRRNGGGSPAAVQYVVSHFLPADRPLVTFYMNGNPSPDKLMTLAELPAGRMAEKPLYVLTSGGSASAAEEFAGHVGGYKLGELVGETTAGAGFRNELVPINGGFVLSVSVGRAVLASTGKDWEAVGIMPTIRTPVASALDAAQAHALRRIAAKSSAQERARLEALADAVAAKMEPRAPALPLHVYAGKFGERVVGLDGGKLYYQRGARAPTHLIPLGGNRFAFESDPALQLEFATAGDSVPAFTLATAGGAAEGRYERTP